MIRASAYQKILNWTIHRPPFQPVHRCRMYSWKLGYGELTILDKYARLMPVSMIHIHVQGTAHAVRTVHSCPKVTNLPCKPVWWSKLFWTGIKSPLVILAYKAHSRDGRRVFKSADQSSERIHTWKYFPVSSTYSRMYGNLPEAGAWVCTAVPSKKSESILLGSHAVISDIVVWEKKPVHVNDTTQQKRIAEYQIAEGQTISSNKSQKSTIAGEYDNWVAYHHGSRKAGS